MSNCVARHHGKHPSSFPLPLSFPECPTHADAGFWTGEEEGQEKGLASRKRGSVWHFWPPFFEDEDLGSSA